MRAKTRTAAMLVAAGGLAAALASAAFSPAVALPASAAVARVQPGQVVAGTFHTDNAGDYAAKDVRVAPQRVH
jgi:hypothetical protein